jgi:AcrR family transcriptional regulator
MGEREEPAPRRRGRPPDSDSADTRTNILDSARRLFAARGYSAVTNRDLAAAAGITTGALYHYVESKLDLYAAVNDEVQECIYDRFQRAVDSSATFVGKLEAVLDAAHEMNLEDPSLARFVGVVWSDLRRDDEVRARLGAAAAGREQFFVRLVDVGVATGEIDPADRPLVVELVRAVLIGLTQVSSETPERMRQAVDGVKGLLRGTLLRPPDR